MAAVRTRRNIPPAIRPWAVEADCYSQLARVQRILHGQGLIQNHFKVENWPEGLTPSTTAPFDYVILLLYAPLSFSPSIRSIGRARWSPLPFGSASSFSGCCFARANSTSPGARCF